MKPSIFVAVLSLVGCGTSSDTAVPAGSTEPATTGSPFDAANPTTPPTTWSREAREAILRCVDTLDGSFGFLATLDAELGETVTIDGAVEACEEAQLQTEVDGSGRLDLAFRELFLKLASESLFVAFGVVSGEGYVPDETGLQAAADLFVERATTALRG